MRCRRRQRRERGATRAAPVSRELPSCFVRFLVCTVSISSPLGWEGIAAVVACSRRESRRETPQRQKCLLLSSLWTKISLRMADDSHENGTSNGDVPEIELIIKVSVPRAVVDRGASEIDRYVDRGEGDREGKTRKKRRQSSRARYGRGAVPIPIRRCSCRRSKERYREPRLFLSQQDAPRPWKSSRSANGRRGNNPRWPLTVSPPVIFDVFDFCFRLGSRLVVINIVLPDGELSFLYRSNMLTRNYRRKPEALANEWTRCMRTIRAYVAVLAFSPRERITNLCRYARRL